MGNRAGFNEDQLFDIASIQMDDNSSTPTSPPAGQVEVYVRDSQVYKKDSAGLEKKVGPQIAAEVDNATATTDNTLIGTNLQAVLNKYYGPTNSEKPTFLANGELDFVEFFSSTSQVTANRIAKIRFLYDDDLNPTGEITELYAPNGITVLKTVTVTHTFSGADYTGSTQVTT
jgi:hypothetical protein